MKFKTGKKILSKIAVFALALSMVVPAVPATVQAADATDAGVVLNKTATLTDDGTYTINLEAYATGETVTTKSTVPTDVVLVLDVSGSMDDDYTYTIGYDYHFVDAKVSDTPTENVYHKCADGTYSSITWTETGRYGLGTYRYVCDNCKATRKWSTPLSNKIPGEGSDDPWNLYEYGEITKTEQKLDALKQAAKLFIEGVADKNAELTDAYQQHRVSIVKFADDSYGVTPGNTFNGSSNHTQIVTEMTVVNSDTVGSLTGAIDSLQYGGATAADYGLNKAEEALSGSSDRNKVILLFTDGEPNHSNGFDDSVATATVEKAKELKAAGATIYTVGLFTDADPADTSSDMNLYMNAVSSNYPTATATGNFNVTLNDGGNKGYYKTVVESEADSLNDIFVEISNSIGVTKVTLDGTSVVKDVLADGFVLPDNFSTANVTVQKDAYSGRDRNGYRVFANSPQTISATVSFDAETGSISVSGYDFTSEYLIDGTTPDSNDFTAAKQGTRLLITITGIEATDEAITNEVIDTNSGLSGVYQNASAELPSEVFPQPKTILTSSVYVLDYGKEVTLATSDWMQSTVKNITKDMKAGLAAAELQYGQITNNTSSIAYRPNTMLWDGYDSFYVFGTSTDATVTGASANANGNLWSKLSVLPANNVYYEDDFITSEATGTVGIVYGGVDADGNVIENGENLWTVDGTADSNQETPNTDVHGGWQNSSLADDATYSDGTAHVTTANRATATFTFTGTGVDVYTTTNMEAGTVVASIIGETDEEIAVKELLIVDNESASGTYYQIPTLSFGPYEHGTYTVKIQVTNAKADKTTYSLDGIRVYNPIKEVDETVSNAYGENLGAVFTEIRELLLDAGSFSTTDEEGNAVPATGVVFIDKNADGELGSSTSNVAGVYEDYGPKNEVYLANGQAIAFKIEDYAGEKIAIGLKAPTGTATKAELTYGVVDGEDVKTEVSIEAASDLYYEVIPSSEGIVMIKNTGDSLLSVTKMQTTMGEPVAEVQLLSLLSFADEFETMPVVAYSAAPEDTETPDEDVTVEPETPEEPEVEGPGDIVIENPEVEEKPSQEEILQALLEKLFSGLKKLFGRR